MKHILFVDDEERVLAALKSMLHSKSKEWDIEFAQGPLPALERVHSKPFDLVVSDMRMPGMSGPQLLERVRLHSPEAIRMILSEELAVDAEKGATLVAHQCLSKPCDPVRLRETLERALRLQDVIGAADLRAIVSRTITLPSPPRVFQTVSRAMTDPNISLDQVVDMVKLDAALSARTLQM